MQYYDNMKLMSKLFLNFNLIYFSKILAHLYEYVKLRAFDAMITYNAVGWQGEILCHYKVVSRFHTYGNFTVACPKNLTNL